MFKKDAKQKETEIVRLYITSDPCQLGLVCGVLKENGLPFLLKDRGTGGYLRVVSGISVFGTEILVNKDDLEKAKELMLGIGIDPEE